MRVGLLEGAHFLALKQVLGTRETEGDTLLEEIDNVATAEEEPAEVVALVHLVTYLQCLVKDLIGAGIGT